MNFEPPSTSRTQKEQETSAASLNKTLSGWISQTELLLSYTESVPSELEGTHMDHCVPLLNEWPRRGPKGSKLLYVCLSICVYGHTATETTLKGYQFLPGVSRAV